MSKFIKLAIVLALAYGGYRTLHRNQASMAGAGGSPFSERGTFDPSMLLARGADELNRSAPQRVSDWLTLDAAKYESEALQLTVTVGNSSAPEQCRKADGADDAAQSWFNLSDCLKPAVSSLYCQSDNLRKGRHPDLPVVVDVKEDATGPVVYHEQFPAPSCTS